MQSSNGYTLCLVRHAQTIYNEKGLMQGSCDSPLTPESVEQAKNAREQLAGIKFDLAFSGNQGRHI